MLSFTETERNAKKFKATGIWLHHVDSMQDNSQPNAKMHTEVKNNKPQHNNQKKGQKE